MNPDNSSSEGRLPLYVGGAVGLLRTAEHLLDEATPPRDHDPTTHAEGDDVAPRWVWIAGGGLLLTLWAVIIVIYPLFNYYKYERTGGLDPVKVLTDLPPLPPAPRDVTSPWSHVEETLNSFGSPATLYEHPLEPDLETLRAHDKYLLSHYLWVDRAHGVVSIPIDQAIQILARRGVAPSQPGGNTYYPPSAGSMRTGTEGKVEPRPR